MEKEIKEIENKLKEEIKVKEGLRNFEILSDGERVTQSGDFRSFSSREVIGKVYTDEDIERILSTGEVEEKIKLSRYFFGIGGFYSRLIMHYATLLLHRGILIPHSPTGMDFDVKALTTRYEKAMDYVSEMKLETHLTHWSLRAVMDGAYYGVITSTKNGFSFLDLPTMYCRSDKRDMQGNDLIEFDVSYFSTIVDKEERAFILSQYPAVIANAYRKEEKKFGGALTRWVRVPADVAIHFSFFGGIPPFLSVIGAILEYGEATETEMNKLKDEIRKIITLTIPHLSDGELLLEPIEARELHDGAVKMLGDNKHIEVLTTYADTGVIVSKTSSDAARNSSVEVMAQNIYNEAGVSGQLFSTTNSQSTKYSVQNDMSFMMYIENQFSRFITNLINYLYGYQNMNFKYRLLPVSFYNESDYISDAFKLASGGYSLLLPAIAMGFSQRDLLNIKELEAKVLKLEEKLVPLSTSYTQGSDGPVKPGAEKEDGGSTKKWEDKAPKTIEREESRDGGNK